MISGRQGLFRQLCDQNTQQCVATEYLFDTAHLVEYIPLPDGDIHASSEWNAAHAPKRVRIDNYFDDPCAWVTDYFDLDPYIQFDFPQTYAVIGVLIMARCTPPYDHQRATKVNIHYSPDSTTWQYTTPLDVYPEYGNTVTYPQYEDSFTY